MGGGRERRGEKSEIDEKNKGPAPPERRTSTTTNCAGSPSWFVCSYTWYRLQPFSSAWTAFARDWRLERSCVWFSWFFVF